jgi:hypothetical protein
MNIRSTRTRLGLAAVIAATVLAAAPVHAKTTDRLTQMFAWWNEALKKPDGFTVESFGKYYDKDASLIINGKVSAHGLEDLTDHFKKIQAAGGEVEIVLPFMEEFQSGDKIFTYHTIRSRRNGKTGCELVAGFGTLKNNKILVVNLVRSELDPATAPPEFKCWVQ